MTAAALDRDAAAALAAPVATRTTEPNAEPDRALEAVLLGAWFSAGFPTGGFAFSHGLERAAAEGRVADAAGLGRWLADLLERGGLWTDAMLFAEAAQRAEEPARLAETAALARALAPSFEREREAREQGAAFLRAVRAGWPAPALEAAPVEPPYAVAAGLACGAHGLATARALPVFLNAALANLVHAALRLIALGQSAGLATLAGLQPALLRVARAAEAAPPEALGGCAFLSDLAAMRHETQSPRIFRS